MILAGDIGGTNARLALFDGEPANPIPLVVERFPSAEQSGLLEIVRLFRKDHAEPINAACFAVAGPVRSGKANLPNLPWDTIDADQLAAELGVPVRLANDLEANAHGTSTLAPEDFFALNQGAMNASGNRVLISAGTGLGQAGLLADDGTYKPWACEGGHCDFAPRNEIEIALLQYLLKEFDHVSVERVLSGPGLHNIYRFLRDTGRYEEPKWLAEKMSAGDPSAIVSEFAMKDESPICWQALDLFVTIYGAEAGNLALKGMATGGVYLGGGIAPKILTKLQSPQFLRAFTAKGRSSALLEAMPIHVIMNDSTALRGAGRLAMLSR